jgi:tetratricopeptide (TPR) repeat protein
MFEIKVPITISVFRRILSYRTIFKALLSSVMIWSSVPTTVLNANAQDGNRALVPKLTLEARRAEDSGDLNRAEVLYINALEQAKRLDSKQEMVEIISRLVRVKIYNHKLTQTGPLVQQAIEIVHTLKNPPVIKPSAWDPIVSIFQKPTKQETYSHLSGVWMTDMADEFYAQGERTKDQDMKVFCMEKYLDLTYPIVEKWDPQYMSKLNMLTGYLASKGRYSEALPYAEKSLAYLEQNRKDDDDFLAYLSLGTYCTAANSYAQAENAFAQSLQRYRAKHGEPPSSYVLDTGFAAIKLEKGDIDAARSLYLRAKKSETAAKAAVKLELAIARVDILLGVLETRAGNLDKAEQYYRASIDYFNKNPGSTKNPLNPGFNDSIVVFASEHLASVLEHMHGDIGLIRSLREQAAKVRIQHPEWLINNPDPEKFFVIFGCLPHRVDLLPTKY